MREMSHFAHSITESKYLHPGEKWPDVGNRVAGNVFGATDSDSYLTGFIANGITDRKFMPGGRYLYAAGRSFHQTQNCLLLRAHDSREGWAEILHKAGLALMTGAGIGIDYSNIREEGRVIKRTGGLATGPIALMQMVNECGRGIMQGGSRRSAIWAGLRWDHPDVMKFCAVKDWSPEVRALKEKYYSFPATLDQTNISVLLNDGFFKAYEDSRHPKHALANSVYWLVVKQMLSTAEPGFSIDCGENAGETLRNACVTGETEVLTDGGYKAIASIVNKPTVVWNGFEWSIVTPRITGYNQPMVSVKLSDGRQIDCTEYHEFVLKDGSKRRAVNLSEGDKLLKHDYPVITGGVDVDWAYVQGFISAEGMDDYAWFSVYPPKFVCIDRMSPFVKVGSENCGRKNFTPIFTKQQKSFVPFFWSIKSRLDWLAGLIDGDGTGLARSGVQIGSVDVPFLLDVQKLLTTLGVNSKVRPMREAGQAMMPDGRGGSRIYPQQALSRLLIPGTSIKALFDLGLRCERITLRMCASDNPREKFTKVVSVEQAGQADVVYCFTEHKRNQGCFNGIVTGQCTEVTSRDSDDICNLGSINIGAIDTLDEFRQYVEAATAFLVAGTVYSDVPYYDVDKIRSKNRRLGLGLMGIHEWLLKRGKKYGPDDELGEWLDVYECESRQAADHYTDLWGLSRCEKVRAIAPTGTISIVAETSSGIEPIFCVAYKRRYLKGGKDWAFQYVVDPVAKRLIEQGVDPDSIEDAYSLADNIERRVQFQSWVQGWVDHGISSTINLPHWGSEQNNENTVQDFGRMLLQYLPSLRGVTCYPDGARGGQPLVPVHYAEAVGQVGVEMIESSADICSIVGKGSCGE